MLTFMNPVRETEVRDFSIPRIKSMLASGMTVNIQLDLNILVQIRQFFEGTLDIQKTEIRELAIILDELRSPNLCISAGNALLENSSDYDVATCKAFEDFCDKFLRYVDHPTNINYDQNTILKTSRFSKMSGGEQIKHSFNYFGICLLNWHYLQNRSSESFKNFVTDWAKIDIPVSSFLFEIAKLLFAPDMKGVVEDKAKIRENFIVKKAKVRTEADMLRQIMNATWDLSYFNFGYTLAKNSNLFWIATLDRKLDAVLDYVWVNGSNGSINFIRNENLERHKYWIEADALQIKLMMNRASKGLGQTMDLTLCEETGTRLLNAIWANLLELKTR